MAPSHQWSLLPENLGPDSLFSQGIDH